jgi:hypothetical protein
MENTGVYEEPAGVFTLETEPLASVDPGIEGGLKKVAPLTP